MNKQRFERRLEKAEAAVQQSSMLNEEAEGINRALQDHPRFLPLVSQLQSITGLSAEGVLTLLPEQRLQELSEREQGEYMAAYQEMAGIIASALSECYSDGPMRDGIS